MIKIIFLILKEKESEEFQKMLGQLEQIIKEKGIVLVSWVVMVIAGLVWKI